MARPRIPFTVDGFAGMRYSRWGGQPDTRLVYYARNGNIDAAGSGSAYRSRPGRYLVSSTPVVNNVNGQLVYQFTKLNGTQYTVAIYEGRIWTLNWATNTWSNVVTQADLTAVFITVSTTARCFAVTLNDMMVISDGVNTPFMWDGSAGAFGLTKLTNCPVLYGQPTVYVAKLFGIMNTNRSAVVWSEENDPTTGYQAGGFTNFFEMSQTGSDPLFAIRGINDGLYFWRQWSVGVIRGTTNEDLASSTTMDSFGGAGTTSPRGVLYHEGTFYFPDDRGRPWSLSPGGQLVPIWRQVSLLFPTDTDDELALTSGGEEVSVTATDLLHMQTVAVPSTGGVLFGHNSADLSGSSMHGGLYMGPNGVMESVWLWSTSLSKVVGSMGVVLNSVTNLTEVLCADDSGYTFAFGKRNVWLDSLHTAATTTVPLMVIGSRQASTNSVEILVDQVDVVGDVRDDAACTFSVNPLTSRVPTSTTYLSANVTTALPLQEKRQSFGFNRMGRWVQPQIELTSEGNYPMALHGYTIHVIPVSASPTVP